jgi:A/G-specific adenine glycosylase
VTLPIEAERNEALLEWYAEHGRTLPWRLTTDPYAVLVSEVMLHQTQVERVIPHYERFLAALPTVERLAAADFAEVARLWSGLGYNTRAKRLQETARIIAVTGWPANAEELAALPGVGPYTAAAVASFAFGERVAAVDTNAKRVLSRWHGEVLNGQALAAAAMTDLADDAASWNQAMMDLGATLCRPRSPKCDVCPVAAWCAGPDTYEPPRPQPRFEGSLRQLRGAVMRRLVAGESSFEELVAAAGVGDDLVEEALAGLIADGLVVDDEDGYRLVD